jgi:hypothetical protein
MSCRRPTRWHASAVIDSRGFVQGYNAQVSVNEKQIVLAAEVTIRLTRQIRVRGRARMDSVGSRRPQRGLHFTTSGSITARAASGRRGVRGLGRGPN